MHGLVAVDDGHGDAVDAVLIFRGGGGVAVVDDALELGAEGVRVGDGLRRVGRERLSAEERLLFLDGRVAEQHLAETRRVERRVRALL